MRRLALFLAVAAVATTLSCATRRYAPIEISASDFDLLPLVGRWSGDYDSPQTGRTGRITFSLQPGEMSAYGDIVMIPRTPTRSAVPLNRQLVGADGSGTGREVLTIHFVRKEGNQVVGMLDPYVDPDCRCRVTTAFQGTFRDARTIEGTFTTLTRDANGIRSVGSWKVTRMKRL